jgi:GNAT superfamily N-acetyltransferase
MIMPIAAESFEYLEIDETWKSRIAAQWNERVERHLHFSNGFTIVALQEGVSIGIISVYWRELPPPLTNTIEGYIDRVEVQQAYRKRGIARQLIGLSIQQAREHKAYQLRAWSSEDKAEAIPMWKRLDFGLCPATTYPLSQEVRGYFVTKMLKNEPG